jgi:H+-transporting ATPase
VFNDGAMIALAKDRVEPSRQPNAWNLRNIFCMGIVYGLYLTLSSWALYQTACKTSFFEDNLPIFSLDDRHVTLRSWCTKYITERTTLVRTRRGHLHLCVTAWRNQRMPTSNRPRLAVSALACSFLRRVSAACAPQNPNASICTIPQYARQGPMGGSFKDCIANPRRASETVLAQCMVEQKYVRGSMLRTLIYNHVSISGQALVFVVRNQRWSITERAGALTYAAFVFAQIGSTVISVFGFDGYVPPRAESRLNDCQFCSYSDFTPIRFFPSRTVPIEGTEAVHTASVLGCL